MAQSSAGPRLKHEPVFLSHRGFDAETNTDIKRTFVSCLHSRLKLAGIGRFMDEASLEPGQDGWDTMKAAIHHCRIAIPVLSAGFGSSQWCLEELDIMLKAPGVVVMPVFLDDSGTGVLKLIDEKSKALGVDPAQLQTFHTAIERVEARVGWRLDQHNGFHGPLVEAVVKHVQAQLGHHLLSGPDFPINVESQVQAIKETLSESSVLGLYGMGGIGKTTLAKAAFNSLCLEYPNCCFLHVGQTGETKLEDLQKQLLKSLFSDDSATSHNPAQLQTEIRIRLQAPQLLIVLDDVWTAEQLEHLLGPTQSSSKVIVTTRQQSLLTSTLQRICGSDCSLSIRPVEVLSPECSSRLFCRYAFFGEDAAPVHLKQHVAQAVEACGGLPLTLTVTAKFLAGKEEPAWEPACHQLCSARALDGGKSNESIFRQLSLSFSDLDCDHQQAFMDIACLMLHRLAEEVVATWHPNGSLYLLNLQDRCLVNIYNGRLAMHDQLRDMGRAFVDDRTSDFFRAYASNDAQMRAFLDQRSMGLNLLGLRCTTALLPSLPRLPSLRILQVEYTRDEDGGVTNGQNQPIDNCSLTLPRLQYLAMACWTIQSISVHQLQIYCGGRDGLPKRIQEWLSTMTSLQSLQYTTGRTDSWEGRLSCLTSLDVYVEEEVDEQQDFFANTSALAALRTYSLGYDRLQKLPDVIGSLQTLRTLDLGSCCSLETLPDSITALTALQTWILEGCRKLQQLPEGLHSLQALHTLDLSSCSSLQCLPRSFTSWSSLQLCSLENCSSLLSLPLHTGSTMQLQLLCLRGCNLLELIPDYLAPSSLRDRAHDGYEFKHVFRHRLQLPQPEDRPQLNLSGMGRLREFPSADNELQSLTMQHCHALKVLPATLSHLQKLDLSFCHSLQGLPLGMGSWPHLERLVLIGCTSLHFSEPTGPFPSLQHLDLSGCPHISLPIYYGCLAKLHHLRLAGGTLKRPHGGGHYRILSEPDLWECKELNHLLKFLQTHAGLQTLDVDYRKGLLELPEALQHASGLQALCASGLDQQVYQGLWGSLPGLVSLQSLTIKSCNFLCAEAIFQMSTLTALQLSGAFCQTQPNPNGAEATTELPDSIGFMTRLQRLIIADCPSLQLLPAGLGHLSHLCILELTGCSDLQRLPATLSRLTSLHTLLLRGCNSMQMSLADLRSIPSLSSMQLNGNLQRRMMHLMRALPDDDRLVQSIDYFRLQRLTFQLPPHTEPGQHKSAMWFVPAIIAALVGVDILRRVPGLIGRPFQALRHLKPD